MISFKEFFYQETMTSTGCIAGFSRMTLPLVRRQWMPSVASELEVNKGDKKSKKKVLQQPQVKD